jgi:hypothetical protein
VNWHDASHSDEVICIQRKKFTDSRREHHGCDTSIVRAFAGDTDPRD